MSFPRKLLRICDKTDTLLLSIGHIARWLSLAMLLLSSLLVIVRSVFQYSPLAVQELVIYMHASLIALCLAWGCLNNAHVRIDILYRGLSFVSKAWISLIGHICFLLPFSVFFLVVSWQFAANSWAILESSGNAGGLPILFLAKSLLPVAALLLIVTGISGTIRQLLALTFDLSAGSEGSNA